MSAEYVDEVEQTNLNPIFFSRDSNWIYHCIIIKNNISPIDLWRVFYTHVAAAYKSALFYFLKTQNDNNPVIPLYTQHIFSSTKLRF